MNATVPRAPRWPDGLNPVIATDSEWHLHPRHPHEFCGGCGRVTAECHPGRCCTDVQDRLDHSDGVCDLCPTRQFTGQAVAP